MAQISSADFGYLRQLVFAHSQNVLDPSRDYLFEARLSRLLRGCGMSRLDELVRYLRVQNDPGLERAVAEAMTINETSFFRDVRPFELLRTEILPRLIESRRNQRLLRFWSAACSSGQESYSLAILMRESFPELSAWDVRIEGTDLCGEIIERARAGVFSRIEINRGLPARFAARYFTRFGEDWAIRPDVKKLCNFRQANLCAPYLPFSRSGDHFDVILLRNVMLYFSAETRKRLLAGMHRLLLPDGVLLLGASEQPADPSNWHTVLSGGACYFTPRAPG